MNLHAEYQCDTNTRGLKQVQSKNDQGTIVQRLNHERSNGYDKLYVLPVRRIGIHHVSG
ncbi:hypothetical protein LQV63_31305 [Paenibacillus profundus]|uniref:Uncharacterized protein n=1 Tax=Paenibacillus profundus TaxID=1173085 RepID=A0ABS8YTN6_9BACL|nr:hypothetical protein [Paenibacillus profundus]